MTESFGAESPSALAARRNALRHRAGVWPLVSNAEMQALDRQTIEQRGIPGEILMESAGRALVAPALSLRAGGPRSQLPIRAFCGAGNNGGDGFVVARHIFGERVLGERFPVEAVLLRRVD